MPEIIDFDTADPLLDWGELTDALAQGHTLEKAEIADTFLYRGKDTMLSRAAWIDGLGSLVKTATVFPDNPHIGLPVIHGAVSLFSDINGQLDAIIDFHLVTKWKTAGDSLLAAKRLARPDSNNILIMGAGTVSANMISAYRSIFPDADYVIWNRNVDKAEALANVLDANAAADLQSAAEAADVICGATMATDPVLKGEWLQPGQHIDLIGAYRPDMREVDDTALTRARIFVDSRDTTLGHIGELKIPLEKGTVSEIDIIADYYQPELFKRSPDDITICKNGGGAHLDLMTSTYILKKWAERT